MTSNLDILARNQPKWLQFLVTQTVTVFFLSVSDVAFEDVNVILLQSSIIELISLIGDMRQQQRAF